MLGNFLKNSEGKFFLELPDNKNQPAVEAMSPQVREDVDEKVEDTIVAAVEAVDTPVPEAKTTATAPAPKAASASTEYVDPNDIINAAIASKSLANSESSKDLPQPTAVKAPALTFAEAHLVNAGNKVVRRRPGISMGPFMDIAQNMKS